MPSLRDKCFRLMASLCAGIVCFYFLVDQYFGYFGNNELLGLSSYRAPYFFLNGVVSVFCFGFIYRIQGSRAPRLRFVHDTWLGIALISAFVLTSAIMAIHRGRLVESVNIQGMIDRSRLVEHLTQQLSFPVVVIYGGSEMEVVFERGSGRREAVIEEILNADNEVSQDAIQPPPRQESGSAAGSMGLPDRE